MHSIQVGFLRFGGPILAPALGFFLLVLPAAAWGQGASTVQNPTVSFTTPGTKQVTLRSCNSLGCTTVVKNVNVLDPKPHVVSVASVPPVVALGSTVTLSAQTTGRPALTHRWRISNALVNIVLTGNPVAWNTLVPGIGSYQVQLEVQNADGLTTAAPFPVQIALATFADVPVDYWAWRFIEGLYASGISRGCGGIPLQFCPGSLITRAEMSVMLVRGIHGSGFLPPTATGRFADVPPSYWAANFIEQLATDGVSGGCGGSPPQFCPDDTSTRAQIAVFLLRARHGGTYQPPPPPPAPSSRTCRPAIGPRPGSSSSGPRESPPAAAARLPSSARSLPCRGIRSRSSSSAPSAFPPRNPPARSVWPPLLALPSPPCRPAFSMTRPL
ncbi:MAG TPA: hypothetical protein VF173_25985 [Thermoanaerobaculia bacterium]|nr:hypothetical protein [Thermoanaerobaculia bacterium]